MINGVAPIVGVLGNLPGDYHDLGNSAVSNFEGATTDIAEYSTKVRLLAKVAALRAIVERRMAQAEKSRPQRFKATDLQVGSLVDLYRVPKTKDTSGWRGPAVVLDLDVPAGTGTIKHQGRVYLVPLRHLRPHAVAVAFFAQALHLQGYHAASAQPLPMICYTGQLPSQQCDLSLFQHLIHPSEFADVKQLHHHVLYDAKVAQASSQSLAALMDLVDALIPGKPFIAGRVHTTSGWINLHSESPLLFLGSF
jgi:hypothetical protein